MSALTCRSHAHVHAFTHMPPYTRARFHCMSSPLWISLTMKLWLEMSAPKLRQFEGGQILALHGKGHVQRHIAECVLRSDPDAPPVTFGADGQAIRHWKQDPTWGSRR